MTRDAALDRALAGMASLGLRRPRLVLGCALGACALAVVSGLGMRFHAEVKDLVPSSSLEDLRLLEEAFGVLDGATVLVQASEPPPGLEAAASPGCDEALVAFARAMAARLEPALFRSVSFGWEGLAESLAAPEALALAPLLAAPERLEALDRLLTPGGIRERVRKGAAQLGLPGLGEAERWVERDPLELRELLLGRLAGLKGSLRLRPGSLHLLSEDGRALLLRVEGAAPSSDIPAVKRAVAALLTAAEEARREVAATYPEAAGFRVRLTGGYAYAFETEAAVRGDLTRNVVASAALVYLLVAAALRRPLAALAAKAPLAAGMVAGFGLFSLVRRELVTLAFVSGALLTGLGIDYVIYIALRAFADPRGISSASVLGAVRATGRPILFAALTTAAAFLAFPLAGERFLADLGTLSALGILACAAAAFVLLPAALRPWAARGDARGAGPGGLRESGGAGGPGTAAGPRPRELGATFLPRLAVRHPRAVLCLAAAAALASAVHLVLRPPRIERDLRSLQARGSEAVQAQGAIGEAFGASAEPVLLLLEARDAERGPEAAALEAASRLEGPLARLEAEGAIASWASAARILPGAAEQRAALEVLARKDARELEAAFAEALEEEGFDAARFEGPRAALRAALARREPAGPEALRALGLGAEAGRLLAARGGKGYALVAVQPRGTLFRAEEQSAIFDALEAAMLEAGVEGRVTGLHAVSARSAAALRERLEAVSAAACAAVVLLVALLFRGIAGSALALLPVGLGTLWMASLCELLGVRLNYMNAGVLPLVLGTGVDVGIHVVRQYLDDPTRDVAAVMARTGPSVLLASLTTLAAFGTMAFSVNQGLASVGQVTAVGMAACLVASLAVLPAALCLHAGRAACR
ncbi:MAG: MMPL family transporter [Planctomycetes bacterium]|nr:MMPL family transporter [Planctomycetota bacterium]